MRQTDRSRTPGRTRPGETKKAAALLLAAVLLFCCASCGWREGFRFMGIDFPGEDGRPVPTYSEPDTDWTERSRTAPEPASVLDLEFGIPAEGSIQNYEDAWYRIVLDEQGTVTFSMTLPAQSDPEFYWYLTLSTEEDSSTALFGVRFQPGVSEDGTGGTVTETTAPLGLKKGIYYVNVSSSYCTEDTFLLDVHFEASEQCETEPNGSFERASALQTDLPYTASMLRNDADFYRFTLPDDGLVTFRLNFPSLSESSNTWEMTVYPADDTETPVYSTLLDIDKPAKEGTEVDIDARLLGLLAGDYFLRARRTVDSASFEEYVLTAHYTRTSRGEDEPNNTLATAKAIAFGKTYKGSLNCVSDALDPWDYYTLNVKETCRVTVRYEMGKQKCTNRECTVNLYREEDPDTILKSLYYAGGPDHLNQKLYLESDPFELTPGRYYFCVKSYEADDATYSLTVAQEG